MSIAPGTFERSDVPPLDYTMGAMLVGVLISAAIWGITCAQAYHYYTHYNDRGILRMVVLTTFLLDTSHQALVCHTIYTYLITWYNNPLDLLRVVWSLEAQILVTAVNNLLVEGFFIWRVWHLGGQSVLRIFPLVFLSLASFSTEILFYSKSQRYDSFLDIGGDISYAYTLGAVGVAANVAISASLILLLFTSRACLPTTNHIIQRLIIFNITTGLPTSLCAVLGLVMIIASPNSWLWLVFYLLISKLVTNSLLMTLNIRQRLRAALPCTVALGDVQFATVTNEGNRSRVLTMHNNMDVVTEALSNVGFEECVLNSC